jgi:hypothetical protein
MVEVLLMNRLPDSVPIETKVSFFEYQRKEWEKVLESSKNSLVENQPDSLQHWVSVNRYALAKIAEIDKQIEELKLTFSVHSSTSASTNV